MPQMTIPPIIRIGRNHWYIIENWDYEIEPDKHWLILRPLNEEERRFVEKRIQNMIEDTWANMTGPSREISTE